MGAPMESAPPAPTGSADLPSGSANRPQTR